MDFRSIKRPMPALKCFHQPRRNMRGMTLIELTVVILVLLSLITALFVGARAWKRGSDRTLCIMNIKNMQQGIRSFSNLYGFNDGDTVPNLKSKVVGPGLFINSLPKCPINGTYTYGASNGDENVIPMVGQLYLECDREFTDQHAPVNHTDW